MLILSGLWIMFGFIALGMELNRGIEAFPNYTHSKFEIFLLILFGPISFGMCLSGKTDQKGVN